jgi:hypothetical protein
MKRLAFLSFTIATLIAPIQVQAQQYDPARNCVRFPQKPNPEAEVQYLIAHPNTPVCPSPHPPVLPDQDAMTLQQGALERWIATQGLIDAIGRR